MAAIYYAKLSLDNDSNTKTPRYVVTKTAGNYEPMQHLIGADGKITMFLRCADRKGKNNTPSMALQAKASLNFTGIKHHGHIQRPRYAYGYPIGTVTYSAKKLKNPFYKYRFDCFLMVLDWSNDVPIPNAIEIIVLSNDYGIASLHYNTLRDGQYSGMFQRWREAAKEWIIPNDSNISE